MYGSLSDKISESFKRLRGKGLLRESDVDLTVSEIRRALIDADVALPVVREFTQAVKTKAYGATRTQSLNPGQQVVKIVHDELVEILGGEARDLHFAQRGPTVFMLAGLQGAGKTTLAGKLAKYLAEDNKRVLLVASDLQRPNAVTQLQVVGERAGATVWAPEPGNGVGDPVNVARSGLDHAIRNGYDVMIVDTAGRLGVDEELMEQARQIRDAVNPHEIMFVLDAMIGQDAVHTATAFRDGVGFTGVVLSKLDGDARGGAALSVRGVTGAPILFASTGEGMDDFERFYPDRMASRILDMGDVLSLIEQAQKAFDEKESQAAAEKLMAGNFTLDDFLQQMQQIRKLGSMKKLLKMLPGAGQFREQLENFDEREIDRIEAIVRSMTPAERADLKILNGSRRLRIAKGSGTTVQDVNGLVQRFEAAQKMMKGGGLPGMGGMAGMPGMPGGRATKRAQQKAAKKSKKSRKVKSGNPAKRVQEAKQLDAPTTTGGGSSFGGGSQVPPRALGNLGGAPQNQGASEQLPELPDDVKRMLGQL
ncbi:signal recognition particle protein [Boudabousia liubingyangii]|uniref:Signal recognition particle protein n=1 Tax=Boudabousia liubingyangii TaxID=1921764 RepID=A0A1Q5PKP6_9ACTO|nr:signal recognition particle protein [Boudabousia liubingyangii]OKL46471.1 signal recognition particle protein [Boudabousia liubingyangii]OKL47206.1 signal recognition particle protein [Boudabousia liubingyangii]